MTPLARNVVANYLGQGWSAVMSLAFIPVYISYLGMEAYGLIGVFAVLQAWLSLLDMGMTPTLTRESARFAAGAHDAQGVRDLLRTLEIICFGTAVVILIGVVAVSDFAASRWLKADRLPTEVVAQGLALMGVVIAARFCEGIYRGALFGLQRQVWYNAANAALATLRHAGAACVLAFGAPTIQAFFMWQAVISAICVAVFAHKVHAVLPRGGRRASFSMAAISGVRKFAGGMMLITFLALMLTQIDKALLSYLLPLESFGYYTLAATVAGVLYMIIIPVDNAVFPRIVELVTRNEPQALARLYHECAQLVTVLTAPSLVVVYFFSGGLLYMWSGDAELARNAEPLLAALIVGTFLNGLMHMPYQLQLAHGWTSLTVKTNLVAVVVLVPAIFVLVPRLGAIGAAYAWIALNAGYALTTVHIMHMKILPGEKGRWYVADVLLPTAGALTVGLAAAPFQPSPGTDRIAWFSFLIIVGLAATACSAVLAPALRQRLRRHLHKGPTRPLRSLN